MLLNLPHGEKYSLDDIIKYIVTNYNIFVVSTFYDDYYPERSFGPRTEAPHRNRAPNHKGEFITIKKFNELAELFEEEIKEKCTYDKTYEIAGNESEFRIDNNSIICQFNLGLLHDDCTYFFIMIYNLKPKEIKKLKKIYDKFYVNEKNQNGSFGR